MTEQTRTPILRKPRAKALAWRAGLVAGVLLALVVVALHFTSSPSTLPSKVRQAGSSVRVSPPTSALPAPKVTLGKYLSPAQAVQRSAMGLSLLKGVEAKLVTFASVKAMLAEVGQGNFFRLNGSAWNPVVPSDPVYAVEASGTIPVSPGHIVHGWELQVLDPLTGRTFGGTGGRTDSLPKLFAALPPFAPAT